MTKHDAILSQCEIAGWHENRDYFNKICMSNKINKHEAITHYEQGMNNREHGIKCSCVLCMEEGK